MQTQFQSENLKGKDHLEDIGEDGRIILKCTLKKYDMVWTRFNWLRIWSNGGLV
jgi:hypothetical protein